MVRVVPLSERRRKSAPLVRFDRSELFRLLSLYSRRVADGEWRDYAIDLVPGRAVFSIFRHTLDKPIYTITKRADRAVGYEVKSGSGQLTRAQTLDEALLVFDRALRVVTH
jgi:hypothetical protein